MDAVPPQGIQNTTGTACHLNSALVIIAYTLYPPSDNRSILDCLIALRNTKTCLDPTPWYRNHTNAWAHHSPEDLGDAVEAIRRMWKGPTGSWQTVLSTESESKCLSPRPLPNPFPLDVRRAPSFLQALHNSWMDSEVMDGYRWDDGTTPVVTRNRRVRDLPSLQLFHLQRFSYIDGHVVPVTGPVDIPPSWNTSNESWDVAGLAVSYTLTGGILHISDLSSSKEEAEDGGHYVSLVCRQGDWFKVDDDSTGRVEEEQVLRWLRGDLYSTTTTETGFACGVLLVYDSSSENTERLWDQAVASHQQEGIISNDDTGRRIRVRWKNGRYYDGQITSYNAITNKHTVLYDDGDVREYNLQKKTYTWIGEHGESDDDDNEDD